MKYLTPRSKLILALVGAWALVAICRAVPTTPPPAAPQITMPSAVPTESPTTRPTRPTATTIPQCDTKAYTTAYSALLDQWNAGATQADLIATVNAITTPSGCVSVQQRIIDRLELATRTGIIATTQREILTAQKDMRACISGLELLMK